MPVKIKLTVVQGEKAGQEFCLTGHSTLLLGRHPDCQICLSNDRLIARYHFIIEANPPAARLRVLGGDNATWVNEKLIGRRSAIDDPEESARTEFPQVDLWDGDEIRAGQTVIKVSIINPIMCAECGQDIPESEREEALQADGRNLCSEHRGLPLPMPNGITDKDAGVPMMGMLAAARLGSDGEPEVPGFDIEKKLGEGRRGAVYQVRQNSTALPCALKIMPARIPVSENSRRLFQRNIDLFLSFRHPHIVDFFDHGYSGGIFFFLLEYCQGGSLETLLQRRGGKLAPDEVIPLMLQALDGLAFIHQSGYVHGYLKPTNILLTGSEGTYTAKIGDLGLAKCFEQAGFGGLADTRNFAGAYAFVPREQITGFKGIRPAVDVWAMGAIFYYLLTGSTPRQFERGKDPILVALRTPVLPILRRDPGIPARIAQVIDRSLSENASERYADADDFRRAILEAV